MSGNLLGGRFSQVAYVTNDFDHALTMLGERMGVTRFLELRDIRFMVGPEAEAHCHVALARSGGLEVELIEPRGGDDGVYRDLLGGAGFALRFHHVAQALPSLAALDAMRMEVTRRGVAIPVDGVAPQGMSYFYADMRAALGHHIEYTFATPGFLAQMAVAVPVN